MQYVLPYSIILKSSYVIPFFKDYVYDIIEKRHRKEIIKILSIIDCSPYEKDHAAIHVNI